MSITETNKSFGEKDLNLENAKLAYTIINSLLAQNEAVTDLVALLAAALDEDTQRALTNTNQWQNYLDARRSLDTTRVQIEKFTSELEKLEQISANGGVANN